MQQEYINAGISIIGAVLGWFVRIVWDAQKEQRAETRELADKLAAIELLVAGQYPKKDEVSAAFTKLENSMEKNFQEVFRKLDKKADK